MCQVCDLKRSHRNCYQAGEAEQEGHDALPRSCCPIRHQNIPQGKNKPEQASQGNDKCPRGRVPDKRILGKREEDAYGNCRNADGDQESEPVDMNLRTAAIGTYLN